MRGPGSSASNSGITPGASQRSGVSRLYHQGTLEMAKAQHLAEEALRVAERLTMRPVSSAATWRSV